jgi:hypothetical protein
LLQNTHKLIFLLVPNSYTIRINDEETIVVEFSRKRKVDEVADRICRQTCKQYLQTEHGVKICDYHADIENTGMQTEHSEQKNM